MSSLRSRGVVVAALLAALLALAVSAPAQDPTPEVPPLGTAAEDDLPRTEEERSRALAQLEAVAECVRSKGVAIPDPVSEAEGVTLGWDGPAPPEADAAIRECHALRAR